tara:strand:+ start:59 stop:499 length:441 start_codon:yes stop_codon:yes gene_type:complete
MKIKSFRGTLADGEKNRIRLSTNQGLIGYRIVKFEILPFNPGRSDSEFVMQVFTEDPGTIPTSSATVNFENPLLLAVAYFHQKDNTAYDSSHYAVFDHVKFNQDIYVSLTDNHGSDTCNYYIELEQVKLTTDEATVATLKDMRGRE